MTAAFTFVLFLCLVPFGALAHVDLGDQRGPDLVEGDIVLPRNAKLRNGILRAKRWTNGIIPYTIDMSTYNQEHVDMIEEAMRTIERHTCIRFVKRTDQNNYITIFNRGKCWSEVGQTNRQQYVSLGYACFQHYIVVHELLHTIGLWHEQSRRDRDQYITVHRASLEDDSHFLGVNLAMAPEGETSTYDIPYNYASVMHYDAWSLGKDGLIVMEPNDPSMLAIMGFAKTANETDFEKVRRIYECRGNFPVVPPANEPCEDEWPDCDIQSDQCKTDRGTINNCRKTCGYCVWGGPITATPRPYCQDYRSDCDSEHFASECQKNKEWRERICPYTCGTCDRSKTRVPASTTNRPPQRPQPEKPAGCKDSVDYCDQFLATCQSDETVRYHCPKTCRLC